MNDSISREAAIDALADYIHNVDKVLGTGRLTAYDCKDAATSVFEELPSAQPEIIMCKDCKYYKKSEVSDRMMCWRKDVNGQPVCYDFNPDDFCSYGERRADGR